MAKLERKIALVTGASSGIGQATAERLATAGYKVYGTSRRGAPSGRRPFTMLTLDVTSDESVEAAVREVIHVDGRIDLLVNNAGFSVAPAGAEESSIEQCGSRVRPGGVTSFRTLQGSNPPTGFDSYWKMHARRILRAA